QGRDLGDRGDEPDRSHREDDCSPGPKNWLVARTSPIARKRRDAARPVRTRLRPSAEGELPIGHDALPTQRYETRLRTTRGTESPRGSACSERPIFWRQSWAPPEP